MLATGFFVWWYGPGWRLVAKNVERRLQRTAATFSVPILLKTLFAPWKRIITTPGAGLDAHIRAFGDNMVSRAIGFIIRLFVLLGALVSLMCIGVIGVVQVIVWPLVLPAIVVGLVKGLV